VLTEELAERCDALLAMDPVESAVRRTRSRLSAHTHVQVQQGRVPEDWPTGTFDLVVLSEVGYYCAGAELDELVDRCATSLTPDGVLVACHWRHPVADYPVGGDGVHARLRAHPGLVTTVRHEEEDFLLDVLTRPPGASVARASGLLGT
jgi:SAM-dependent methyltransferase